MYDRFRHKSVFLLQSMPSILGSATQEPTYPSEKIIIVEIDKVCKEITKALKGENIQQRSNFHTRLKLDFV